MSNFGLDETLAARGGKVVRTKVGDRYVIEEMMQQKLNLGGEQSGHIIFRDFTTTGDGIISALQILRIMHKTGQPLSKLKTCLQKYPQAQRNLVVKEKRPLAELPTVMKLVNEAEKELSGKGRVLLRYSGTEPKIRLLIEGRELDKIDKQADRIADAIQHWNNWRQLLVMAHDQIHEPYHASSKRFYSAHKSRSRSAKSTAAIKGADGDRRARRLTSLRA